MSIHITGDCHGDIHKLNTASFPEQTELSQDDYVIILGDFGMIWDEGKESKHEKYWLDWLSNKPFTTLFVCGNHENFDRLYQYPVKKWHNGQVHEIRPNVLHLMRGNVFDINNKSFFAFGGAQSHDISGGILDCNDKYFKEYKRRLERDEIPYRIDHLTWWKEEMPNEDEKQLGIKSLTAHDNQVDYILTHDCPASTLETLGEGLFKTNDLNNYLEQIKKTVQYKYWFFGHYHLNKKVTPKDIVLYDQIVRIM